MSHPVAEQYRLMLGEVAFVEYQEKLGAVGFQPLDGMRNSSGEIPHIAHAGIGRDLNLALFLHDLGGIRRLAKTHAHGGEAAESGHSMPGDVSTAFFEHCRW